ncbi:hypothetical protein [Spirosoma endophyticum]|uniref:hypothetical protein n=1 Tax=Spirosoma endophyticum TaxID=662367 RepID=UPI001C42FCC9|nr:hypothetical protein [Spirosoma endophyticum]
MGGSHVKQIAKRSRHYVPDDADSGRYQSHNAQSTETQPVGCRPPSEGACLTRQEVSVNQVHDGQLLLSRKGDRIRIVWMGLPHTTNTPF